MRGFDYEQFLYPPNQILGDVLNSQIEETPEKEWCIFIVARFNKAIVTRLTGSSSLLRSPIGKVYLFLATKMHPPPWNDSFCFTQTESTLGEQAHGVL